MNLFQEMFRKTTSSFSYDKMQRFVKPLNDHFGVNHFWYYRVSNNGHYAYMGTHADWSEYCFENHLIDYFPCLRHPSTLQSGINLMKGVSNEGYEKVLTAAQEKFQINFNFQLLYKIPDGIEGFGFATQNKYQMSDEQLLNELPLLRHFIKVFRERHVELFNILHNNQVDLSGYLGPLFNEKIHPCPIPNKRENFLKKIGFESFFDLTSREKNVLKYLAYGYPASFIAKELNLQTKTVENYIAVIKCKLVCRSKVELIQKAQEIASIGCFE